MPGKARRVASRQAQLSRKRRKPQKGAPGLSPTVQAPAVVDGNQPETAAASTAAVMPPTTASAAAVRPVAAPAAVTQPARRPGTYRGERLATSNYIGPELRRILLLASAVLVGIIVLGILL